MSQPWSPELVITLGLGVLAFCVIVIIVGTILLRRRTVDGNVILKFFGLTMIISVSAFLLVVGYGKDQLTPIVGLFGAIAGYLLGKDSPKPETVADSAKAEPVAEKDPGM